MSTAVDRLMAATITGNVAAARRIASADPDAICVRAEYHGVLSLLADRLASVEGVPVELASRLSLHAARQVACDLLQETEIQSMLAALHQAEVRPLLLKGTHLAYAWYKRPDLRPRADTDILIPVAARVIVGEVLRSLGYEASPSSGGELVSYQAAFVKHRQGLRLHVVDVHWRIANPQVFAGLLAYQELARDAIAMPLLAPHARGLSAAHALLLACVHRVAHHFDSNRLIWLYDIHLLASGFSGADWEQFLILIEQRRVAAVCRRSLERAAQLFETNVPSAVASDARFRMPATVEASAAYTRRRRVVRDVACDLQALPSWRDRLQLVREHLFPPREYMREVYSLSRRGPLPWLYASRAVRGAWRWLDLAPASDDVSETP
jgi:putative nucleotidyltransferase-like protein